MTRSARRLLQYLYNGRHNPVLDREGVCFVSSNSPGSSDQMASLHDAVLRWEYTRNAWQNLSPQDRARYTSWVLQSHSSRQSSRRALVVQQRVLQGLPWAGAHRRLVDNWFRVPRSITGIDAGDFPADPGSGTPGIH